MTDLLKRVVNAHGGESIWHCLESIDAAVKVGGAIWAAKGVAGLFENIEVSADLRTQSVLMSSRLGGWRSSFKGDTVTFESSEEHGIRQLEGARGSFSGHNQSTPWDKLHAIYFCSYALWTYLTIPFVYLQPGFETIELPPWQENGETWRRLEVSFPNRIVTHSQKQVSYFGPDGLLRRHDYTVDIMGGATGANYASTIAEKAGLMFPTKREVYAYDSGGKKIDEPLLVSIEFEDILPR